MQFYISFVAAMAICATFTMGWMLRKEIVK